MAAQKGNSFLFSVVTVDNASPTEYVNVGGFRTKSMTINNSAADVTNQESQQWREILSGGGIRSADFSGSGQFIDDTGFEYVRDAVSTPANIEGKVTVPGLGTFVGMWHVSQLQLEGPHDQGVSYSFSLQSAGPIVFATA